MRESVNDVDGRVLVDVCPANNFKFNIVTILRMPYHGDGLVLMRLELKRLVSFAKLCRMGTRWLVQKYVLQTEFSWIC